MICPKCRKQFSDNIQICPDCGVELIGLLGSADAEDDEKGKMQRVVVDENGLCPVVYRLNPDEQKNQSNKLPAVLVLCFALVFAAASAYCFYKGGIII